MISIPRINIAHLPTPVEQLPRLSSALGGPTILVKRDDQTGLALGGNKTRKLEFLLAEAQAHGARTLVTAGALQSNHCRQTAAAAAKFGFECILVLYPAGGLAETAGSLPPASANLLIDRMLGAEIVLTSRDRRDEVLKQTFQQAWEAGQRPFTIPYGGSNSTGAAAYVFAMQEFLTQFSSADWIVFPSSSGGTHAGLALGKRLFGFKGKVLGISVDEPENVLKERVASLATETADFLSETLRIEASEIDVNADFLGGGYGVLGEIEREAIGLFALQEGLLLDPVYTGRAAAGLVDLIRKGTFRKEETVLFWHTGGTPALFADQYRPFFS